MSFGYDPSRRYRQRSAERRRKIFMGTIILAAVFYAGYVTGSETVLSSQVAYKKQAEKLQSERAGLERQITDLQSQVQSTQVRYTQLEELYKKEVPTGKLKILTDLARRQLENGLSAERLEFVLGAARPPRNCTQPQTKRFVVKTPVYSGPDGYVSYGNGAITITGKGDSAFSSTGQAEAWYDPGKPVTITFTQLGGREIVKTGLLPITHSLVTGGREFRFTVAAGERSFIAVTADSCDYP